MDEIMLQTKYRGASVYQSKPLIEACKKFDINEGRLFYLGLLELRPQLASGQGQEKFTEVDSNNGRDKTFWWQSWLLQQIKKCGQKINKSFHCCA